MILPIILTFLGTTVIIIISIYMLIRNCKKDIINRIDKFESRFESKRYAQRTDAESRLHVQRTDQLYQMFVNLLKPQNPKSNP